MLEMLDKKSLIINATRKRMNERKNPIKNQLIFFFFLSKKKRCMRWLVNLSLSIQQFNRTWYFLSTHTHDGIPNKLEQFELEFLWRSSTSSFSPISIFDWVFRTCLFGGNHKWKMITDHFGRHEFWSIQCDKRTGKVTHLLGWLKMRNVAACDATGESLALNKRRRSMQRFKVKHHVSFSDLLIKIYVEWKMMRMDVWRRFFCCSAVRRVSAVSVHRPTLLYIFIKFESTVWMWMPFGRGAVLNETKMYYRSASIETIPIIIQSNQLISMWNSWLLHICRPNDKCRSISASQRMYLFYIDFNPFFCGAIHESEHCAWNMEIGWRKFCNNFCGYRMPERCRGGSDGDVRE